ncbi:MAG: pyridoxine 5'-phosphate synthase [Spirochaetes bacterium]|nr:pyridoxine 5'-phosphate synthase [Spirochaetota bacterium]
MIRLGVNIDHVATLRNARGGLEPEPVVAAGICASAGADSIVVHLREDRRHIHDDDVLAIRRTVDVKLNLEMSIDEGVVKRALEVEPNQATLVPEKRRELTTEGGLDVIADFDPLKDVADELKKKNIIVSLFVEPDKYQIEKAKEAGAQMIEIHTGHYADYFKKDQHLQELKKIRESVLFAREIGIEVACGHGLTLQNVPLIAGIKDIVEFNIGHSIISKALFTGLYQSVKDMKRIITDNRLK